MHGGGEDLAKLFFMLLLLLWLLLLLLLLCACVCACVRVRACVAIDKTEAARAHARDKVNKHMGFPYS
jgi:hypothetical protein